MRRSATAPRARGWCRRGITRVTSGAVDLRLGGADPVQSLFDLGADALGPGLPPVEQGEHAGVADAGAELAVVRQEAAAARALAAGADRDVAEYRAELRAHTRTLNALRETQLEHYAEHKADATEIKTGIAQIAQLLEGLGGIT